MARRGFLARLGFVVALALVVAGLGLEPTSAAGSPSSSDFFAPPPAAKALRAAPRPSRILVSLPVVASVAARVLAEARLEADPRPAAAPHKGAADFLPLRV